MVRKILIIFFALVFVFPIFKVNAQVQSGDIILEIDPKFPQANEEVTASLSTFVTDLNNAKISWKLNGEAALEGVGKTNFSFNVGDSGTQTSIEATIETLNGSTVNKKLFVSPSGVDMLWEAYNTYVPPFYKGKALAPIEGMIKVVAIPGSQNMTGYNYKWKQDSKNQLSSSGYEKNSYIYKNSYLDKSNDIEVSVSDLFSSKNGLGKITITPIIPKIILYEKDLILGTKWDRALNDRFMIPQSGTTIVAAPYFFSIKDLNSSNYSFDWFLNGEQTLTPNQRNSLTIKPEGGRSGSSSIKITINNIPTLFQSVDKEINVNF